MFTPEERARLRSDLLDLGSRDPRISGGAITGSAAGEREDRWSDIDLALGVINGADLAEVLSDWTAYMYDQRAAVHDVDTKFGAWMYRSFLLPSTLQVDLGFAPATEFRALTPTFHLVFGRTNEPRHVEPAKPTDVAGAAWPSVLKAQSCIARGRLWEAECLTRRVRDQALALACIRYGLPSHHGRGIDLLPSEVTVNFENSLVRQMDVTEVSRGFQIAVDGFLSEVRSVDERLAKRLQETLIRSMEERDEHPQDQPSEPAGVIGLGWLYALHARSCIARGKLWQAEYMISGVRDNALALACMRNDVPADQGRGIDLLPSEVTAPFESLLVRQIHAAELSRAFQAVMDGFLTEVRCRGEGFAERLEQTLGRLGMREICPEC